MNDLIGTTARDPAATSSTAAHENPTACGSKRQVLMVDDDPEYADLLKFALGEEGLDVHCAYSGIEALQIARSSVPSVILLDVMLPDIDGLALCEMFNSQAATRDIPIIFLTALSKSWTETRRSKARYIWFLQKPVSLPVLQKLVRTVISESKRTGDPLRNAVSHD